MHIIKGGAKQGGKTEETIKVLQDSPNKFTVYCKTRSESFHMHRKMKQILRGTHVVKRRMSRGLGTDKPTVGFYITAEKIKG